MRRRSRKIPTMPVATMANQGILSKPIIPSRLRWEVYPHHTSVAQPPPALGPIRFVHIPFRNAIHSTLAATPVCLLRPANYTSLPMPTRTKKHFILHSILAVISLIGLVTPLTALAQSPVFAQSRDACPDDPAEFARIEQIANSGVAKSDIAKADKAATANNDASIANPDIANANTAATANTGATNNNLASAQTALAFCYDLGRHVQPSRKENMRWLELAAGHNYAPAEYELGRIYLYGRGVPADYPRALVWERKAAEQGDPRAQRDLAFMYERGFGVAADPAQAAEWNHKAAAQGHADAQLHLAQALAEGSGVKKDPAEARQWYARAAKQDSPAAQLQLARSYARNDDCASAIRWYKEAATGGETQAMHELGRIYLNKKCGADPVSAFQWFTTAARFGSQDGKAQAAKLAPRLSPAQRKSAQLAVDGWIRQHPGSQKEEDEEDEGRK
jgi:TPR repeat protein